MKRFFFNAGAQDNKLENLTFLSLVYVTFAMKDRAFLEWITSPVFLGQTRGKYHNTLRPEFIMRQATDI